jgi:hypothetical protein
VRRFTITLTDVLRCPRHSLLPDHYRDDGTCRCDEGSATVIDLHTQTCPGSGRRPDRVTLSRGDDLRGKCPVCRRTYALKGPAGERVLRRHATPASAPPTAS